MGERRLGLGGFAFNVRRKKGWRQEGIDRLGIKLSLPINLAYRTSSSLICDVSVSINPTSCSIVLKLPLVVLNYRPLENAFPLIKFGQDVQELVLASICPRACRTAIFSWINANSNAAEQQTSRAS